MKDCWLKNFLAADWRIATQRMVHGLCYELDSTLALPSVSLTLYFDEGSYVLCIVRTNGNKSSNASFVTPASWSTYGGKDIPPLPPPVDFAAAYNAIVVLLGNLASPLAVPASPAAVPFTEQVQQQVLEWRRRRPMQPPPQTQQAQLTQLMQPIQQQSMQQQPMQPFQQQSMQPMQPFQQQSMQLQQQSLPQGVDELLSITIPMNFPQFGNELMVQSPTTGVFHRVVPPAGSLPGSQLLVAIVVTR